MVCNSAFRNSTVLTVVQNRDFLFSSSLKVNSRTKTCISMWSWMICCTPPTPIRKSVLSTSNSMRVSVNLSSASSMLTMIAVGDTVVRELDFSRVSLRVRDSGDDHDEEDKHKAKLTGNTM